MHYKFIENISKKVALGKFCPRFYTWKIMRALNTYY